MNTQKLFELYATYAWPVVRHFVRKNRRCRKCILSERYSPLHKGLCGECAMGTAIPAAVAVDVPAGIPERFDRTVRSYVGDRRYDALLLLSGGKDSAFILHRMRQEYPALKILCLTVNNGFMSPMAIPNATHVAEKLQTDLLVSNSSIPEFARVLRQAFLDLKGRGAYGVVDYVDGSLIFEIGKRTALALEIPLLIGGLTWVQVQRIVGRDDFELRELGEPHIVFPLAVWRPNEQEIRQTVRRLNLLLSGSDSPMVSNSSLILAMSAVDMMNLGYSSFEPEFAQLIREGKTDRKTWLHLFELLEFAQRKGLLEKDLKATLGKLNLSIHDIVRSPA